MGQPTSLVRRVAVGLALAFVASAVVVPVANAHGNAHPAKPAFGTSVANVNEVKANGWTPAYGLVWATVWSVSDDFNGLRWQLRQAKAAGVTPVIEWYYWGDAISVNAVKYGTTSGRTEANWHRAADRLATVIKEEMGSSLAIVVLETEFNKNGIQTWEPFDGMLAKQSWIFRNKSPTIHTVVGFGKWGESNWGVFDQAVGASHYTGTQLLYSAYRQSDAQMKKATEDTFAAGKLLHDKFGKRVLIHDYAVASWNGKDWIQKQEVQELVNRKAEFSAAGMMGIVYRSVRDDPKMTWGYHGHAEKTFGLKTATGGAKSAYWPFVNGVKGTPSATTAYNA